MGSQTNANEFNKYFTNRSMITIILNAWLQLKYTLWKITQHYILDIEK